MKKKVKSNHQYMYKQVFVYGMVAFITVVMLAGYFSRGEYLINLFFLDQNDHFMDFFNSIQYGSSPYEYGVIYPPLINAIYGFIGHFIPLNIRMYGTVAIRNSNIGLMVFFIYNIAQLFLLSIVVKQNIHSSTAENYMYTSIIFFTQPVLWCLQRGNSVLLSVIALMAFVNLYQSEKKNYRTLSYIMLGIAAAIKIYPALYGLLYIRKSNWKETIKCIIFGVICFFMPFLLFDGGFANISKLVLNIVNCSNEFALTRYGVKHNLTNFYNILNTAFGVQLKNIYVLFTILIITVSVTVIIKSKNMIEWKIYALLSSLMIFIPSFSFTYNLTFMIIPLTSFLSSENKTVSKLNYVYSILFLLIFAPVIQSSNDILAMSQVDCYPLTIGTLIQNIALIVMIILICIEGSIELYKNVKARYKKNTNNMQ